MIMRMAGVSHLIEESGNVEYGLHLGGDELNQHADDIIGKQ